MPPIFIPLVALALLGPDEPSTALPGFDTGPQAAIRELQPFTPPGQRCRDGAAPANEQPSRQPRLERQPATPDAGPIIYAVDLRVDGCSVILVKGARIFQPQIERPFNGMQLSPEEIKEALRRR